MSRLRRDVLACLVLMASLSPATAHARQAAPPASSQTPTPPSRLWIAAGAASTTLLGDCTGCDADTYVHSYSVGASAGITVDRRLDVGGDVLWVPTTLETRERLRATFLLASARFRPWASKGFFVNGGMGMAFVRNWLNTIDPDADAQRSKAFALALGAGWEWRASPRFGVQVFGAQHVAALGDLDSANGTIENVVGNLWSVGAAVVIR